MHRYLPIVIVFVVGCTASEPDLFAPVLTSATVDASMDVGADRHRPDAVHDTHAHDGAQEAQGDVFPETSADTSDATLDAQDDAVDASDASDEPEAMDDAGDAADALADSDADAWDGDCDYLAEYTQSVSIPVGDVLLLSIGCHQDCQMDHAHGATCVVLNGEITGVGVFTGELWQCRFACNYDAGICNGFVLVQVQCQ